jgi:hypothetical protein
MKLFTIFTQKTQLHVGDKIDVPAEAIPVGAQVVFKHPTDPLNPIARGKCTGNVPPLFTPSKNGQKADAHRMYKTFEVTEEV